MQVAERNRIAQWLLWERVREMNSFQVLFLPLTWISRAILNSLRICLHSVRSTSFAYFFDERNNDVFAIILLKYGVNVQAHITR